MQRTLFILPVLVIGLFAAVARPVRCGSPRDDGAPLDVASARRVLGITGAPKANDVRAAFHKASLQAHPDKEGGSTVNPRLKTLDP
jgi:hypothetical protein